jgi:hypothetical protein
MKVSNSVSSIKFHGALREEVVCKTRWAQAGIRQGLWFRKMMGKFVIVSLSFLSCIMSQLCGLLVGSQSMGMGAQVSMSRTQIC